MRRVLATDLGIWPMLQDLRVASDRMVASQDYWAKVANYILLYDQIVIPTGNLQILPVLRIMLGESVFDELIRNKGIVLTRFDHWIGYAGNGAGLVEFQAHDNPDSPSIGPNIALAFFKPLDEAINEILAGTYPTSGPDRRNQISRLLLDNVIELPTLALINSVKKEAYKDILGSPYLRDFMAIRNAGRSLNNLLGIKSNQLTVFNPHVPPAAGDSLEIRSVLRVAFENFLLSIGSHIDATEITGDDATLSLLRAKGQRLGYSPEGDQAFTRIQQINGVPDLGSAFAVKQLSPQQLLDLRYSKHTQSLRDWFAEGDSSESTEETIRRYVESIGKPSWIESLPSKLLRFATTTGIGVLSPLAGAAASALDTFMLSKWFPVNSPRLFLEQAKVILTNTPKIPKPIMHGRDRNLQCSCGSGKKYKKCCGK